jgi:elongation factor P
MDNETYDQISVEEDLIGEPAVFLQEGMQVSVQSYEEKPISVTIPGTVTMRIEEADPVTKGQTASSSYKPASSRTACASWCRPMSGRHAHRGQYHRQQLRRTREGLRPQAPWRPGPHSSM